MIDKIREEELREKRDKLKAQGVKSTKMEVVEEKELNEIIKKHEEWADFFGMDCTNPQIDEDGRTTFEEGITYDTNDGLQKINKKERKPNAKQFEEEMDRNINEKERNKRSARQFEEAEMDIMINKKEMNNNEIIDKNKDDDGRDM